MTHATRDVAEPRFPVLVVLAPFALVFARWAWFLITPRKAQAVAGVAEPGQ